MLKRKLSFLCIFMPAVVSFAAAQPARPDLSAQLDTLFNKRAYQIKSVQLAWQKGGQIYTILEPSSGHKGMDIVAYDSASGQRSVLVSAAQLIPQGTDTPLRIDGYSWSPDRSKLLIYTNSKKVWRLNTRGDYWVFDEAAHKLIKLGGDIPASTTMFATFSPDSAKVAWVHEHNLYVEDLTTQKITQLTTDGSADIINGTSDWVSEEELDLRNCLRWSPDSKSIAYWQFDQSGVGDFTLINDTEAEYPVLFTYKYPQPGTTNSAVRAGVVPVSGGPTQWISLPGDPRQHYIARMEWAGNSHQLLLEYLDRLQQHNQVMLADAHTGQSRLFFEDDDKAWDDIVPLEFIGKGGEGTRNQEPDLLWLSERDGWRHAYRVDRRTGQPRLITNFQGDVIAVDAIDAAGGWLYFTASPDDPVRTYLYRSRLDGTGSPERVTPSGDKGSNGYNISANGEFAIHVFSTFSTPPRIDVVSLPDHKVLRTLVTNEDVAKKAKALLPGEPEFLKVPVKSNGVTLDGWMIKPPDFDPSKKYPVLTYVYGEPAATTVQDRWQGFLGLYHAIMAQQGYIVVSFDNEGTPAPKGREWRKCIYGAVGVLSSAQQSEAIENLAKDHPYIDTSRMAVWGHSGGGSNTLNLMFRYPGVYSTGIASSPVADEAHYDSIYQERYMGLPQQNKQGYHDGSPINFAEGLKGNLLLVHGSGDDNVHFQGTELLINRLIDLSKPFQFMDYPNRTHCLCEGRNTVYFDYSTMARYIEDHVPPGAR
ncbi:MAG: S9 family peptidase [Acidobacteriota bacterium]